MHELQELVPRRLSGETTSQVPAHRLLRHVRRLSVQAVAQMSLRSQIHWLRRLSVQTAAQMPIPLHALVVHLRIDANGDSVFKWGLCSQITESHSGRISQLLWNHLTSGGRLMLAGSPRGHLWFHVTKGSEFRRLGTIPRGSHGGHQARRSWTHRHNSYNRNPEQASTATPPSHPQNRFVKSLCACIFLQIGSRGRLQSLD